MTDSLSTLFVTFASLIAALLFSNNGPSPSNGDGAIFADDGRQAARDVVRQVHDAIAASNFTLIVELGMRGKLIAKQIHEHCNGTDTGEENPIRLHNWGGHFKYGTQNIQYPRSTAEVQQIVRKAKKLRVVASRHSFTKIADSPDTLLSTLGMNSILSVNTTVPSVTVQAGITYTDLAPYIQSLGYALPNLAALAEISVAGAIATGTHGSGMDHQNLASQVLSMQMVLANGTVAAYKKGDPEWNGLVVGLGAFGVITELELQLEPAFNTTTHVFLNMPIQNLWTNFDAIMSGGYTVQMFSAMTNATLFDQVWVNVRSDAVNNVANLSQLFGAVLAPVQVSPIATLPSTYLVHQGVEQPWYEGLTDYGFGLSGADGNEIQTEYFVPYAQAVPALKAVHALNALISPILYVWFIRAIKSDPFWLSQCSGGDHHVSIHFTWQPNITAVLQVLPQIDAALLPFSVRPHWGKLFTLKPRQFLRQQYPKLEEFKKLAKQLDPKGKFRNDFLDENVFLQIKDGKGN